MNPQVKCSGEFFSQAVDNFGDPMRDAIAFTATKRERARRS
jgi:hypothetical protein